MIFRNVSEGLFSCPNNFRNEIAGCDVTFETFITPNKAHRVDRKVGPVRSISILINSMPDRVTNLKNLSIGKLTHLIIGAQTGVRQVGLFSENSIYMTTSSS